MNSTYLIFTLFTLLFQIGSATTTYNQPQCRCLPSDSCWPKDAEWTAFNASLSGKLLAVKPVASVCHDPAFSETACQEVNTFYTSSLWRSDQPGKSQVCVQTPRAHRSLLTINVPSGALDQINFENSAVTNETCYIDSPRSSPCGQGSLPIYAIVATSPQDIQGGVDFGRTHNLRLSIKNSGHDYLGRSTARGSLQIWTHNMKSMDFSDDFLPGGCSKGNQGESAVTIGAGVQLRELYLAATARGKTLVAGFSNTVGAAGGYILGGGHSPLGPWKGMASDNALQFTVVTADVSNSA